MSQTITISAPIAMSAVPALMLAGGLIVGLFLRGDLATAIEAARLNAENDARTARWLFLRGYRKTPHAGPDLTPEPLALSDRSHADEQADHTDTDRKGIWRVLLGLASDLVDRAHDWLPNLLQQWRERNQLGSGQPSDDEPWVLYDEDELRAQGVSELELKMLREGYVRIPYDEATDAEDRASEVEAMRAARGDGTRKVLTASGYELDIADEAELDGQRAEWVALNPPTNHGPDGQRHWNDVTAMHGIVTPGRHAKMPINLKVPAQRDGGDLDA